MFLLLSRFCDLIDLTGPKHLKEVTHVDEFDIPGFRVSRSVDTRISLASGCSSEKRLSPVLCLV